jgi:hypothetical protein
MSELGEKSIFVQIRATVKDRDRLKKITRWSSADSASEMVRMLITERWKQLPEEKQ